MSALLEDPLVQTSNDTSIRLNASLIGWHGRENAGDDAFCVILAKWLAESLGANKIEVSAESSRLPILDLSDNCSLVGVHRPGPMGRLQRFLQEPKYLFGKDLIIYGAGSIFSVRRFAWLTFLLWILRTLRWLRINKSPIAAIGVSIGPFRKKRDRFWCRQVLRQFDVVMVRDQKSFEIGSEFGIKRLIASYDLALALPKLFSISSHEKSSPTSSPVIGFSLVDRDAELGRSKIDETKNDKLFQVMRSIAKEKPETLFRGFVFCNDLHRGDLKTTETMLERLRKEGYQVDLVEYQNDPLDLIDQLSKSDVMICNRMHSFVFACLSQTPAVMLSYAPKMTEFARALGVPEWLQFSHNEFSPEVLQESLTRLLKEGSPPCDEGNLRSFTDKISEHLDLAAEVLREKM